MSNLTFAITLPDLEKKGWSLKEYNMIPIEDAEDFEPDFSSDALDVAKEAHAGQFYVTVDDPEEPYIYHIYRVAESVSTWTHGSKMHVSVAYLHDIVEDTEVNIEDIRSQFGDQIADAVQAITHDKEETYNQYIVRVKKNPIARLVKIADIMDNLFYCMVEGSPKKKLAFRYATALLTLISEKK